MKNIRQIAMVLIHFVKAIRRMWRIDIWRNEIMSMVDVEKQWFDTFPQKRLPPELKRQAFVILNNRRLHAAVSLAIRRRLTVPYLPRSAQKVARAAVNEAGGNVQRAKYHRQLRPAAIVIVRQPDQLIFHCSLSGGCL